MAISEHIPVVLSFFLVPKSQIFRNKNAIIGLFSRLLPKIKNFPAAEIVKFYG